MAQSSDAYPEFKEQMNYLFCKIGLDLVVLIQAKIQLASMEALAKEAGAEMERDQQNTLALSCKI